MMMERICDVDSVHEGDLYFRNCLLELDSHIDGDTLKDMKFLMRDYVSPVALERIDSGRDLFTALQKAGRLSENDKWLLGECLWRVGLGGHLDILGLDYNLVEMQLENMGSSTLSPYRRLLYKLASEINTEDVKLLLYQLNVKRAKLDSITSGVDLFVLLEKMGAIGPQKLEPLIKAFRVINRADLMQYTANYSTGNSPTDSHGPPGFSGAALSPPPSYTTMAQPAPVPHLVHGAMKDDTPVGRITSKEMPKPVAPNPKPSLLGVPDSSEIPLDLNIPLPSIELSNMWSAMKPTSLYSGENRGTDLPSLGGMVEERKQFASLEHSNDRLALSETENIGESMQENISVHIREASVFPAVTVSPNSAPAGPERINDLITSTERLQIDYSDYYQMDRNPRGICVIINNQTFFKDKQNPDAHDDLKNRDGSQVDAEKLETLFTELNFKLERHNNLTHTQMVQILDEVARRPENENSDCFVCCILSHGIQDYVYGVNSCLIPISELTSGFKSLRCPSLNGKPKLFFIQACQGKHKQEGAVLEEDAPYAEGSNNDPRQPRLQESIPNEADFLLGYATVPGFVSYRSRTFGSWYITKLTEFMRQFAHREDILSILTRVNNAVAKANAPFDNKLYKQIPAPVYTLRKKVQFFPLDR